MGVSHAANARPHPDPNPTEATPMNPGGRATRAWIMVSEDDSFGSHLLDGGAVDTIRAALPDPDRDAGTVGPAGFLRRLVRFDADRPRR